MIIAGDPIMQDPAVPQRVVIHAWKGPSEDDGDGRAFHPGQRTLAAGDVDGLAALLAADPELATARSQRSHPTLLQCLVLTMPPVETLESLVELLAAHGAELTVPLIAASGVDNLRAIRKLLELGGRGSMATAKGTVCLSRRPFTGGTRPPSTSSSTRCRGRQPPHVRGVGDMEAVAHCFDETGALTEAAGEVAWPFGGEIPGGESVVIPGGSSTTALVYAAHGQDRRRAIPP